MKCASCGEALSDAQRFCSRCGTNVLSDVPTATRTGDSLAVAAAPAPISNVGSADYVRFLPGTVIAERYRVVGQIGRGGMGEVYRADDLRLGQPVALKFLPEALTSDPAALARLHREVRTARQVSHPNVCRVFDIGEADHVPFITMEFVDGEDLGSLLRRIGRLQPGKALQLAHQLCAGLAEIHAFGILHRDLKPANIMLDGRGNLRITDFGLAVVANQIPSEEAQAGTPAYMAPEQLSGEKPSQQSDIYALGLILYELFTGKPAFVGLRTRDKSTPKPSSLAKDLDPVIERAILRCLEKEPAARPRTASIVASAFPGGDPLAAAIAAGETPSPEMVAAAIDEPAIGVRSAWMLLAAFFLFVVGTVYVSQYAFVDGLVPPPKPAEVLADHAQEVVQRLGYPTATDSAYWVTYDFDQMSSLTTAADSRHWRRGLPDTYPTVQRLFYRQSPKPIESQRIVNASDPPMDVDGMVLAEMDQRGRLLLFRAVPPQMEEARPSWPEPDWASLFAAADLPQTAFASVPPKWRPPVAFDRQAAWEGDYSGHRFHITAASFHGRTVYFEVLGPWHETARVNPRGLTAGSRVASATVAVVVLALWVGGFILARRNWRAGRGDATGALKLGLCVLALVLLSFELAVHHSPSAGEYGRLIYGSGVAFHVALLTSMLYLALEPLVRRRWPHFLVGWTRALAGRFGNSRVGRDTLVGLTLGAADTLLESMGSALPYWFNIAGERLSTSGGLGSFSSFLSNICAAASAAVLMGVAVLAVFLLISLLVRKDRAALAVLWVGLLFTHAGGRLTWMPLAIGAIHATLLLFLLVRLGLLAAVASLIATWVLEFPFTADFSRWYFGRSATVLLIVTGLAVWAFRTALGERPAFGIASLEE